MFAASRISSEPLLSAFEVNPNANMSSCLPISGAASRSLKKLCPLGLVQVPSVSPKRPWTKTTATLLLGLDRFTQCGSVVFAAVLSLPQPATIDANPMTKATPRQNHAVKRRADKRCRVSIDLLPKVSTWPFCGGPVPDATPFRRQADHAFSVLS